MRRRSSFISLLLALLLVSVLTAGCGNDESYWGTPNPGNAKVYYAFEQELARAVNANATTVEMKAFDANGAAVTAALVEAEIEKMDTDDQGRYLAGAFVSYKAKELVYAFRNGEEVLDMAVVPVTVANNMVIESEDSQFVDVEALAYDAEGAESELFAVDDTITVKVFANEEEITDQVVLTAETENVEQIVGSEVTNEFKALADGEATFAFEYKGIAFTGMAPVTIGEGPIGAFAWLLPDNYNLVDGKIMDGETEISADDIVAEISMEPQESRNFGLIIIDETAADESYAFIDEKVDVTLDTETADSFSAYCSIGGVITIDVAQDAAEGDKAALTASYEGYELQNEIAVTVTAASEPVTAWVIPAWYTIENGKLMDGDQEVSPEDAAAELSGETQRVNPGNTMELRVVAIDEQTEESVTYKFAEESFDIELDPDNGNFSAECSADGLITIKADDSAEFEVETTFTVSNDNYDIQNTVTAKVVDFEV